MRAKLLFLIATAILGFTSLPKTQNKLETIIPRIDVIAENEILFELPEKSLDKILTSYFGISNSTLKQMRSGRKRWPTGNGGLVKLPDSYLTENKKNVYNESRLLEPVATAFQRMADSAMVDGIHIRLGSGYRTEWEQEVIYARAKGSKKVAPPGGSHHHEARAVDIANSNGFIVGGDSYRWLRRNAKEFGFTQTVPFENWHWEYSKNELKKWYVTKMQRDFYYEETKTDVTNYFSSVESDATSN